MYVYDNGGKPTWSTATLRPAGAGWSGDLYLTTGPWYGTSGFDPQSVTVRKAGTMTWTSADASNGTITYSIDGVPVGKNVVRQYLDTDDYSGKYSGMLSWKNSCTDVHENYVEVVVTQVAQNVSVNWDNQTTHDSCSFAGAATQEGQFGKISGTFECGPVHDDGTFKFSEMRVTPYSLTGRYSSRDEDTGCTSTGYLGLARHR
jgi:hypothetical protein